MTTILRQVKLTRPSDLGTKEDVFWIDNDLAKKGKKVIDDDDIVWTVAELYNTRTIAEIQKEYETWRRFRDVLGIKNDRR